VILVHFYVHQKNSGRARHLIQRILLVFVKNSMNKPSCQSIY